MKRYAIADEVPGRNRWLVTAGKEYEIDGTSDDKDGGWVTADDGAEIFISYNGSAWLNGKSWRIVEREE